MLLSVEYLVLVAQSTLSQCDITTAHLPQITLVTACSWILSNQLAVDTQMGLGDLHCILVKARARASPCILLIVCPQLFMFNALKVHSFM